jgi:hypothetical protein
MLEPPAVAAQAVAEAGNARRELSGYQVARMVLNPACEERRIA